jgi:hypothetical protein
MGHSTDQSSRTIPTKRPSSCEEGLEVHQVIRDHLDRDGSRSEVVAEAYFPCEIVVQLKIAIIGNSDATKIQPTCTSVDFELLRDVVKQSGRSLGVEAAVPFGLSEQGCLREGVTDASCSIDAECAEDAALELDVQGDRNDIQIEGLGIITCLSHRSGGLEKICAEGRVTREISHFEVGCDIASEELGFQIAADVEREEIEVEISHLNTFVAEERPADFTLYGFLEEIASPDTHSIELSVGGANEPAARGCWCGFRSRNDGFLCAAGECSCCD